MDTIFDLNSDADVEESTEYSSTHEPHVREPDGAVCWPRLMCIMYDPHPNTRSWNCDKWLSMLPAASARIKFNIVLIDKESLSTSDRYKVTVAYQEFIKQSLLCWNFRMCGKYTSTMQDLRTMTGQSSKED